MALDETPTPRGDPGATADERSADVVTATLSVLWPQAIAEVGIQRARAASRPGLTQYAVLPSLKRPTLLVPLAPRAVTAATLRSYRTSRSLAGRARMLGMRAGARAGLVNLVPGRASVPNGPGFSSLVTHFSEVLDEPVVAAIRLGPPRANRKPVLQLFDQGGHTRAFAKVGVNRLTSDLVRAEATALESLAHRRLDAVRIPRLLASGSWNDVDYLLLAPLATSSSETGIDAHTLGVAMDQVSRVFGHSPHALAGSRHWRTLHEGLALLPGEVGDRLRRCATALEQVAGDTEMDYGSWHGDWTPWNMAASSGAPIVWDWERFETGVPIGMDAVHFHVKSGVRVRGLAPRAAIREAIQRSSRLLAPFGAPAEHARTVVALYLLHIGQRHAHDQQDEAGAKTGPLKTWLLPELESLVADLGVGAGM